MTQAEDQMRQGKSITAIDTYQNAIRVTPQQSAGSDRQGQRGACATPTPARKRICKQVFLGDKKVLMGQYDLRKMIGDDCLFTFSAI